MKVIIDVMLSLMMKYDWRVGIAQEMQDASYPLDGGTADELMSTSY